MAGESGYLALAEQGGQPTLACAPAARSGFVRSAVAALGGVALGVAGTAMLGWTSRPEVIMSTETAASTSVSRDGAGGPGAPLAKQVVVGMDTNVNFHVACLNWDSWSQQMAPYWTEDMIYDFNYVGEWGFGATHGLRAWYDGEHVHFNKALPDCQWMDFIRAADHVTATSASYGIAQWVGDFAGVPAPPGKPWVRIRDLDFYLLREDRIAINWCIIDVADLFEQVGYKLLPPAPLRDLGYKSASSMDGFPAPMSAAVSPEDTAKSTEIWSAAVKEDYLLGTGGARHWANRTTWYGPKGFGTALTREEYNTHFVKPFSDAFANKELQMDLLVCEGTYCGAHFYIWGDHIGTFLGAKATGRRVPIRCGAHARIANGEIVEGWLIIDHPRMFHGMGIDFYQQAKEAAFALAAATE